MTEESGRSEEGPRTGTKPRAAFQAANRTWVGRFPFQRRHHFQRLLDRRSVRRRALPLVVNCSLVLHGTVTRGHEMRVARTQIRVRGPGFSPVGSFLFSVFISKHQQNFSSRPKCAGSKVQLQILQTVNVMC